MGHFEPYLLFRLMMALFFSAYILYDLIGLIFWYRALPRLAQRIVLLKLLQFRSGRITFEFSLLLLLAAIQAGLMYLLVKGI